MGTIAQANAMRAQAQAEQQAANYKAQVENQQAQEDRAAAQRRALAEREKTQYAQSQLQALAAASGGGADDPTIIKLSSDIAAHGEYNALADMYTGESKGVDLENQANLDVYSGAMKADAMRAKANSTIMGGFGGLFTGIGKAFG
jgi:hypothetical protein